MLRVISSFIRKPSHRRCISSGAQSLLGWGRPHTLALHTALGHWNDVKTVPRTFILGVILYPFFFFQKEKKLMLKYWIHL